jgi:hypothetical protein
MVHPWQLGTPDVNYDLLAVAISVETLHAAESIFSPGLPTPAE